MTAKNLTIFNAIFNTGCATYFFYQETTIYNIVGVVHILFVVMTTWSYFRFKRRTKRLKERHRKIVEELEKIYHCDCCGRTATDLMHDGDTCDECLDEMR